MKSIEQALQTVRDLYIKLPKEHTLIVDELRVTNNEIQDLLHVIELGSLDAVAMTRVFKELKKVRLERRKLKNEVEVLEEIRRFIKIKNPREHDYGKVIGEVRAIIEKQGRRTYTMRVRKDLQGLVSKQ